MQLKFDLEKKDVVARLLEGSPLLEHQLERNIRNELRQIEINTPGAYEKLAAIEQTLARHPNCVAPNEVNLIRVQIGVLESLCSLFRALVGESAQDNPPPPSEDPSSTTVRYSTNKAVVDLQIRAEHGDADAQFRLGMRLLQGAGVPKNVDEGVTWLRSAGEMGHTDAKYELGRRLLRGLGMQRNVEEGRRLLNDAAKHGHRRAASELRGPFRRTDRR